MRCTILVLVSLVLLIGTLAPSFCALAPQDLIVVYNKNDAWKNAQNVNVSKAVADYYCNVRGIPSENEFGIDWASLSADMGADQFINSIVNDRPGIPGLASFLSSRPGFNTNDPSTDPSVAIVLCYGVPMRIWANERSASVDSAISLLFNTTAWGQEQIGLWLDNLYHYENYDNPIDRGGIPADFREFRGSTYNNLPRTAPSFTTVRMLDTAHALAAGHGGILYRGTWNQTEQKWDWTVIGDVAKQFILGDINEIRVLDSSRAWLCTNSSSVLKTTDGGQNWTAQITSLPGLRTITSMKSVSFYSDQNGWVVGTWADAYDVTHQFVYKWNSGGTNMWGNLPSDFVPASIVSTDSQHVWVSGTAASGGGGIWCITDGGSTWTHCYTPPSGNGTGRIWVNGSGTGYAIGLHGKIVQTTDGTSWTDLTSPTVSGYSDIAAFDASHIAIASGAFSFLTYDGSSWVSNSSGQTAVSSVAWAASDRAVGAAASGSQIMSASGSPGTFSWVNSHTTSNSNVRVRYLVTRLDAYSTPVDEETGIPTDVKNMIDRAATADANGPGALTNAKFVLDDSPNTYAGPRYYSSSLVSCLQGLVGTGNVYHETDPDVYVRGLSGTQVIGYSSDGSYDATAANATTSWYRPMLNDWRPGSIGVFWKVSGDAIALRTPSYSWGVIEDVDNREAGIVKAFLWTLGTDQYANFRLCVHLNDASQGDPILASAPFDSVEQITSSITGRTITATVRVAKINLSNITWPSNNHAAYIALHFPNDDPGHPGEKITPTSSASTAIYNASSTGITYGIQAGQCLDTDLIHEGCCGTTGNVTEPYASGCPCPEVIFPQYASGRTWAESASMGLPIMAWKETIVGDPLMSPYAVRPTVAFESPTPSQGDKVRGSISLKATATPYGSGSIQKVEFWVVGNGKPGERIGSCNQAPYVAVWDSLQTSGGNRVYPNGTYQIQAVAYQAGANGGTSTVSRSVVLDDSISSVSITNPVSDNSVVDSTTQLAAQVSPTAGTTTFWLFGNGDPIQLTGNTVPGSVADGEYQLQAIAIDHTNSPYFSSYSSRRPIRVVDNFASNLGGLGSFTDGTTVYLAGTPVVAGSSAAIDYPLTSGHAFYLEDATRFGGIRVVASNPVQAGRNVSVLGVFHVGNGISERYIQATQVWDDGTADVPAALGMNNKSLGGKDTDNIGGQPNPGLGNVGVSARIWGTVTYVDATNKFAYIDDGSGVQDGNSLSAVGVRVYFGDFPMPTVDNYIAVTGISSVEMIGGYRERMLRLASDGGSDSCSGTVTYVGSDFVYVDDGSHPSDGNEITAPRIVPQDGSSIPAATVGVLGRKVVFGSLAKPGIDDEVSITGVSYYSYADGRPAPMCVSSASGLTYVDRYIPARSTSSGIVAIDDPYTVLPAGTKVKLTDAYVQGVDTNYFFVRPAGNWPAVSCAVPTALTGGETVTITGQVLSGRDQNGWLHMTPNHIYLGGSTYGAMSVTPQGPTAMSISSLPASSGTDGTEGGGPFRPWPGPTAEEILASDSFQQQYSQVGAIGWVLSQSDGALIDLSAEATSGQWYDNRVFGLREWFEPIPNGPRLYLYLNNPVQVDGLGRDVTIDIVGATLTTLSNGQRALVRPTAVYAYTDQDGRFAPPLPWLKYLRPTTGLRTNSLIDSSSEDVWPWKLKIAP